ncbi:MAG TPA: AsmA-like C-terminal region-containing protein, partial [Bacteroidia bacterium]|nr:AsmA-like C-terminal region-containing protein [Bacteroidia bacterium]
GKKLIGTVTLAESAFTAESLSIETLDGTIKANGQIDASQPDLQIALHANFDHIDATKTFYAFNNFGQNALTADNIKGEITAQVQLTSTWTKQLVLENNSLYSNCKIKITNGALINFKPMMSLGRYLKEADLNKVTFDTLNNTIEIKNGTIYIPLMHINSSALKLKASGSHTFDNMVDYHIQLGLSQLLNKKIVNNQTEFGQIEDDGLGNWQLYLKMTGNIKDPKFAYDKKSVKQHISKQVATEKQTVKDLFKKEFGWFKGDSTQAKNPKPQKQKEAVQIDYDDE